MSAAAGAFEAEFRRPEMVDTLHELLNLAERTATFARVESIFQSSGWGKSRTICELWRRDVWVIYCSLGQGSGYPRRSAIADWFLQQTSSMITADLDGQLKCMAFCLAYFEAALTELLNLAADRVLTPQRFVRMMYKSGDGHMGGEDAQAGARYWQLVKERTASLLLEYSAEGLLTARGRTRGECWRDWETRAVMRMGSVTERVGCELLGRKLNSDDDMEVDSDSSSVRVLFVFDEARILVPEVLDKNVYLPLRRATSSFAPLSGVFVLFADTAARISNFSAPIWMDPSDRMPGTNLTLATPIWSCFWADHGVADWSTECDRKGISEHNVLSEYWPLRYGRPLWWYMFKNTSGGKKLGLDLVVRLACDKLLGGSGAYAKHVEGRAPLTPEMAIAVLGCRCALSVDPRCSAVSTLVASFLMTVVKVDDSREYLYADWPMEPIVASAAARIMRVLHEQQRASKELYFPMAMALKNAWISKGYKGELFDRIILLRAFDKATAKSHRTFCTLDAFIEELLGTSLLQLIKQTGEVAADNVKELAQSKLCFTAFHKIHKKSYELTEGDFKAAAERRCAIVAQDNTWGDDNFITDETGAVKVHNQVKCRVSDTAIAELAKESPPFCGLPSTRCFLSLHINVLSMDEKVTIVDPVRVENAVRSNKGNKVIRAVLEREAEQRGETSMSQTHWSEYQKRFPRLFGAWESWLAMPRRNQVILKIKGLGAFKHLLDQEALALLRDMSMDTSPLDPSNPFQSLQKESVASMFPGKNLA